MLWVKVHHECDFHVKSESRKVKISNHRVIYQKKTDIESVDKNYEYMYKAAFFSYNTVPYVRKLFGFRLTDYVDRFMFAHETSEKSELLLNYLLSWLTVRTYNKVSTSQSIQSVDRVVNCKYPGFRVQYHWRVVDT